MSKYQSSLEQIPQNVRGEINGKILGLIASGTVEQSGITNEDIFNSYTGDGGLHGLERSSYNNYHEYSEAKKEIEQGQFFTAPEVCQYIMECVKPSANDVIFDLTSGMGNFANYAPNEKNFYGSDIDLKALKVAMYLYPDAHFSHSDIRSYKAPVMADLVVGNPPFNLKWTVNDKHMLSQMYYCIKAAAEENEQ